jgi:hypothetical protein
VVGPLVRIEADALAGPPVPIDPDVLAELPVPIDPDVLAELPVPIDPDVLAGLPVPIDPDVLAGLPVPMDPDELARLSEPIEPEVFGVVASLDPFDLGVLATRIVEWVVVDTRAAEVAPAWGAAITEWISINDGSTVAAIKFMRGGSRIFNSAMCTPPCWFAVSATLGALNRRTDVKAENPNSILVWRKAKQLVQRPGPISSRHLLLLLGFGDSIYVNPASDHLANSFAGSTIDILVDGASGNSANQTPLLQLIVTGGLDGARCASVGTYFSLAHH